MNLSWGSTKSPDLDSLSLRWSRRLWSRRRVWAVRAHPQTWWRRLTSRWRTSSFPPSGRGFPHTGTAQEGAVKTWKLMHINTGHMFYCLLCTKHLGYLYHLEGMRYSILYGDTAAPHIQNTVTQLWKVPALLEDFMRWQQYACIVYITKLLWSFKAVAMEI